MPLTIIDNGHTIQINAAPGSFITVGDHRYELKQFHFHRPSEEAINGKHAAMVVHFVHADTAGKLAVVAVPPHQGRREWADPAPLAEPADRKRHCGVAP